MSTRCPCSLLTLHDHNQFVYDDDDDDCTSTLQTLAAEANVEDK